MQVEVAGLSIYPIKSLAGISVGVSDVEARGLRFDRRWMLVEEDGTFITQRDDPSLTQIKIRKADHGILISVANEKMRGDARLEFDPSDVARNVTEIPVRVWKSELVAHSVSPILDEFFSAALGRRCHLVSMPEDAPRRISPEFGDAPVSFADAMPILVLSEASMDDLNSRLETPIPLDRFRANLILKGLEAYQEDELDSITIGDVRLKSTKRCGRCLVTCTDQETGERGTEPLRTLASYRQYGNNACMGMYFYAESVGRIAVGDVGDGEWSSETPNP